LEVAEPTDFLLAGAAAGAVFVDVVDGLDTVYDDDV
jgi:hypothetical protein